MIFLDDNEDTRRLVESCYQKKRTTVNPIIDWTEEDVWEFLNEVAKVPHCSLYDEGYTRIGCVGCPLQGREGMIRDFERYPAIKNMYIKAFEKMIENHPGEIKVANGESVDITSGGVLRYTQGGSTGASDGEGISDQWRAESDESSGEATPHTQRRDRNASWNGRDGLDSRTDIRSLARLPVMGQSRERERERDGRLLLEWWMWMHRHPNEQDEPSPLKW